MHYGITGFELLFPPPDDFTDRWVLSKAKSDYGKFKITAGDFYGDAELDKGMVGRRVGCYGQTKKLQSRGGY